VISVHVASCVVEGLLASLLLVSAVGKLAFHDKAAVTVTKVGFPERYMWMLAMCEIVGAIGIVVGLFWWPIAIAAGSGVVLYFISAVVSHLRVKDFDLRASGGMLLLSLAALLLRVVAI
jgi:uncharacterized membrane protein YphA (DoxX/SURF4 family)